MQTDWYKTKKPGTYLILPTGASPNEVALSDEARALLEGVSLKPFFVNAACRTVERSFNFHGVECCLRQSGFSLLKS